MKAYVLNHDDIKQYILIIVVALIISFSLGYYIGGMDSAALNEGAELSIAESDNTIASDLENNLAPDASADKSENSELTGKSAQDKVGIKDKNTEVKKDNKPVVKKTEPVKKPVEKKVVENKKPLVKEPTKKELARIEVAKVKVDKTESGARTVAEKTTVKKETVIETKQQTAAQKNSAQQLDKPDSKQSENRQSENAQSSESSSGQNNAENPPAKPVASIKSDQRIYSIQVGMFASKSNAESFIEKLTAKDFDAYVSDFVSSSGAIKYNVRIGQFEQRDQARDLLKEFKKSFSSPAYVVIAQ